MDSHASRLKILEVDESWYQVSPYGFLASSPPLGKAVSGLQMKNPFEKNAFIQDGGSRVSYPVRNSWQPWPHIPLASGCV